MAIKQHYGIKFPFTNEGFQKYYVDLNENMKDKVRSQLMYLIFTPKGQVLRNPQFGTDLIKYIFEQNDTTAWNSVKDEIREAVMRWVPNTILNDISVVQSENDDHEIFVRLDYSVTEGNKTINDSVVTRI